MNQLGYQHGGYDSGSPSPLLGQRLLDLVKIALVALLIVLPIRLFLVQPFFVRGASMEPTFHDGDYLIVDEISYHLGEPQRGDVIVFRFPLQPSQFFIKRVVGLPGETITMEADGSVRVQSDRFSTPVVYNEPMIIDGVSAWIPEPHTLHLDEDEFYVLGDNRESSSDSRRWGPLEREFIVGRAWLRLWPFERAEKF